MKREPERASMRPRRVRLGWGCPAPHVVVSAPSFNEAEARAPRMVHGLRSRLSNFQCFNEAEARAPRMGW